MLVLTRKLQEKIQIGNDVTLTIVRIQGNTVRVGIEAPSHVRVVRGELYAGESAREAGCVNPISEGASEGEAAWTAEPLAPIPATWPRQAARERRRQRRQAARMHAVA